nr:MAG TPA: hypothetical protein [Siphoviridae sp. ctngg6]
MTNKLRCVILSTVEEVDPHPLLLCVIKWCNRRR